MSSDERVPNNPYSPPGHPERTDVERPEVNFVRGSIKVVLASALVPFLLVGLSRISVISNMVFLIGLAVGPAISATCHGHVLRRSVCAIVSALLTVLFLVVAIVIDAAFFGLDDVQ